MPPIDCLFFVCLFYHIFAAGIKKIKTDSTLQMIENYKYSKPMSNQGFDMAQRRQEINPEALLEGLTEIGGVLTAKDALSAGMERLNELSETEIAILLRLNNDELKANFFKKKFLLGPISPIPDEGATYELKSGLKAIPNTYWATLNHGGIKLIFTELCALYNSTGNGTVYIGVSDSKRPTALERQIACMWPNMNRDKFCSTVLFNIARTWTMSDYFLSSMTFEWFKYQNHLLLKISVQKTVERDIVLCNPKEWYLPYRVGTSLRMAKGYDILKMYDQITKK